MVSGVRTPVERLRDFFEVDWRWITVRALKALADEGVVQPREVTEALRRYNLDAEKPNPRTV